MFFVTFCLQRSDILSVTLGLIDTGRRQIAYVKQWSSIICLLYWN